MKLALSSSISKIDEFVKENLGIQTRELINKSGEAVAKAVRLKLENGKKVVVLAGKGNNGADGYAAAIFLLPDYDVVVVDVLGMGLKNNDGKHFYQTYVEKGGKILNYETDKSVLEVIKSADCVVDAIFGTGFKGEMPEKIKEIAFAVRAMVGAHKIAVDVPLGVNADNGSVSDSAIYVGSTVQLSYVKPGIISYPAKAFVGKIIYDDLDLPMREIESEFEFNYRAIDERMAKEILPKREENSNKGSFGKLLLVTGSAKYRGAAHLGTEAALRSGVGVVTYLGTRAICSELAAKFPEVIYKPEKAIDRFTESDIRAIVELSNIHSATLIGSGSNNTDGLLKLVLALLSSEGTPLILDADAINALSSIGENGIRAIREAKRKVVITPHPLEFARISQNEVSYVQLHRLEVAEKFAKENNCLVILKGAGTIISNGHNTYIDSTGTSALSKAGSGDVLAGVIASFIAQGKLSLIDASALAVYFHSKAGENLSYEFSSYGVTPSDLPCEIARCISAIEKTK